ncbi:uncharacterized protein CXQ87_001150 [Candidozyma duobushaemuli]|uniref:Uncharacterized protein n=1 Tax=Candidozyma duobushaemuli TaxID=1231522 RepID=A0A2V1AKI1_9ASCO|nr:uncharacterized protein CXQ87_001150 [[Candida] duobushaemulonis]PVH18232.1 hypothetical protein CXQ87_001150 [[Candida] duobushaemulonis]
MVVGESRTELLNWLNATLNLNYSKVEQCGTGAAYCQLMDSIYGGVPMGKVKFDPSLSEYDSRANMKVLQAAFNKQRISKQIEVERLIKCRLQDNLELLQWFKRHWMEHKDVNVVYDAASRRKSGGARTPSGPNSRRSTMTSNPPSAGSSSRPSRISSGSYNGSSDPPISVPKRRVSSQGTGRVTDDRVAELMAQLDQAKAEVSESRTNVETLETERNFYFNKLREIEILTQHIDTAFEKDDASSKEIQGMPIQELVKQVQDILWQKDNGFESNAEEMDAEFF